MSRQLINTTFYYSEDDKPEYQVSFYVDDENGDPLWGAKVIVGPYLLVTDVNGIATTTLSNGSYSYKAKRENYSTENNILTVNGGPTSTNITLVTSAQTFIADSYEMNNGYVQIPSLNHYSAPEFTMETKIKIPTLGLSHRIFSVQRSGFNSGYSLEINSNNKFIFNWDEFRSTADGPIQIGTYSVPLNQTIHVSLTRKYKGDVNLYVDGNLIGTITPSFFTPNKIGNTLIGGLNSHIQFETRFWTKILSQSEIQDNMSKQLIGTERNLFGYWRLDKIEDGQAKDLSINQNHGNIVNNVQVVPSGTQITELLPEPVPSLYHFDEFSKVYDDVNYVYYEFHNDTTLNVDETLNGCQLLLVGAGGGSSGTNIYGRGGGGAGGYVTMSNFTLNSGSHSIIVGEGIQNSNGEDTVAFGLNAIGGGSSTSGVGNNGGSGAGGTSETISPAAGGLGSQGSNGGTTEERQVDGLNWKAGAGGGGAGSPGLKNKFYPDESYTTPENYEAESGFIGGDGGNGLQWINGVWYAGGGGGGNNGGTNYGGLGYAGTGGGGFGGQRDSGSNNKQNPDDGLPNTGGGAGGAGFDSVSPITTKGGSGIVIVAVPKT